jgi:cytochrome c oxidase cbb3-type subunit 3
MANREDKHEIDEISGTETTGHSWDGIKELNTPLPRWWLWTFYATIVWAIGYMIAYPAIPLATTATPGLLGWSSRGDLRAELAAVEAARAQQASALADADMATILASADMRQVAEAGGRSAFKVYCIQCHGSGAQGGLGYPNLNDDDWIWGGKGEDIYITLKHGIRHPGDENTRLAEMPAFGRDGILTPEQISDVAWYVRKLSGQENDAAAAERAVTIYAENCAVCHGEQGEGIRDVGGPRLADAIWLYGGSHAQIVSQLNAPKQGVMPAWSERLSDTTIKQLAAYVHGLGGGE